MSRELDHRSAVKACGPRATEEQEVQGTDGVGYVGGDLATSIAVSTYQVRLWGRWSIFDRAGHLHGDVGVSFEIDASIMRRGLDASSSIKENGVSSQETSNEPQSSCFTRRSQTQ